MTLFIGLISFTETKSENYISSYGSFYSHLAPHGVWMQFDDGLVVWRPTIMRRGWAPYSVGRWIWTEYGWYWDSYESFGYITYHYGRWFYDDYYGWIWIPDYDWAPSWVEWRYDNDYIGWAPLPPYAVFSMNIGIHFTINYVTPYNHWHFVKYNYVCDPYVYNHYVGSKYKYRIYSNTKYRNDYHYSDGRIINRGVDVNEVRTRSGQEIRQRTLRQVSDPKELVRSEKDRKLERNTDAVRTFIPSRDQIRDENSKSNDLRRVERKSSIETSKIQLGDRTIRNERIDSKTENNVNRNRTTDLQKRDDASDIGKNRTNEKTDVQRNPVETRKSIELEKRENSNNNIRKKEEVVKPRNNETQVRVERNTQTQTKQNEVKIEKRTETTRQIERNTNQRTETRSNEVRSNDERTNQTRNSSEKTRTR